MKKIFPTLYDTSKSGKTKQWLIFVESLTHTASSSVISVEHGYVDGKKQIATEVISEGKNIGRSNETTAWEQAISQAQSKWQHQKDKGYVESLNDAQTKSTEKLPMLAHKYSERSKYVKFPCFVQPKLNGLRCLATKTSESEIKFMSRGGKEYKLNHLVKPLLNTMKIGDMLDGELFIRGVSLMQINSWVKKPCVDSEKIQYWIYDIATENVTFNVRLELFETIVTDVDSDNIVSVPTILCADETEVYAQHKINCAEGFEGTMIRNVDGLYMFKHRSNDLLKLKDFADDEFKIIGAEQGVGKFEGVCIFICAAKNGKPFNVVCEGPMEMKKQQWIEHEKHIGKMLTVRYQELSPYGIPQFPVGVDIRPVDDLS